MPISAEVKGKITDAGALAEVEKVESLLFDVTEESKKWKIILLRKRKCGIL